MTSIRTQFRNEGGEQIQLEMTRTADALVITMEGPGSIMENEVSLKEAGELFDMLGIVLGRT